MKKLFTQAIGAMFLFILVMQGVATKAQTSPAPVMLSAVIVKSRDTKSKLKKDSIARADSVTAVTNAEPAKKIEIQTDHPAWAPVRRLWGYAFGDEYYVGHADAGGRGSETNYAGVPTYRNAFQFRRIYLGYDYDISQKFTAEVLLSSEPTASTGVNGTTSIQNGDNLVDGKEGFFIKLFNLRYRNIWTGTDLVIGEMSTPGFALNEGGTNAPNSLSETTWSYRSVERTITDFHKNNSYDLGAALQGTFDPATKNYGYVFMVGNNSTSSLLSAANPNTGFYKMFYGDIWGKFLDKKLVADFYADYLQTAPTTASTAVTAGQIDPQSHNMFKIFAAYTFAPQATLGVEAYTQKITNGVINTGTKAEEDATVNAISIWLRGSIMPAKLGYFARYDHYNPDTKFNDADSYTVNTNYGSYNPTVKENFYTAGLDFTPEKSIHFMPNIWLTQFMDQRATTTTGYVANDHTIVYRMTFFYTFGN